MAIFSFLLAGCIDRGRPEQVGVPDVGEGIKIEDRVSQLSDQFGVTIPDMVEKALLEAVDESPSSGLATREITTDKSEVTILANLPDIEDGYTARLLSDGDAMELGDLQATKGGWLLEKQVSTGLEVYRTVEVRRGDQVVLRGEFEGR